MASVSTVAAGADGSDTGVGTHPDVLYERAARSSSPEVSTHVTQPSATPVDVSAAEQEDLNTFARQRGVSLSPAQVRQRYGWRDDFAVTVTAIREQHPNTLAGSAAEPGDGYDAWVAFTGDAPTGVEKTLAGLPVPVQIREGQGWNEPGLVEPAEQLHAELMSHSDVVSSVATDPDVNTGSVTVRIRPRDGMSTAAASTQLRGLATSDEVTNLIDQIPPEVAVEIRIDESVGYEPETVYGGGRLSTCTAGFSVQRANSPSQRGVTTADHCQNSQNYAGRNVLTWYGRMATLDGDVQWHRSSEAVGGRFHHDTGSLRNQGQIADPAVGTPLCKYGITTRKTCSEVYKLNQCRSEYCGLAMTYEHVSDDGDSGGPWYSGTTAFGIHSGHSQGAVLRSMFTPVREAHLRLGLLLL